MGNYSILIFLTIALFVNQKEKYSDKAGKKMQKFIIDISNYARENKSDFIVVPQNGSELAFNNLCPEDGLNISYLAAINGIGAEELFYNGSYSLDNERLNMLRKIVGSKTVMVAEHITNNNQIANAIQKNLNENFICFPRISNNYDYTQIPNNIINENANDIKKISDAQNYLYLINSENYASSKDFINAIATTNFDVILIDLFFNESVFSVAEIEQLKTKANGGKRLVLSYMNIGAAESNRYYWKKNWKLHHPQWLKKSYKDYKDEIWVKFWKKEWQNIIYGNDSSYIKKIIDAGFDGAYLDNVEAYYFLYHD